MSSSVSSFLHDSSSLPAVSKCSTTPSSTPQPSGPLSWDNNDDEEEATLTEEFARQPEESVENVEHWDDETAHPIEASSGTLLYHRVSLCRIMCYYIIPRTSGANSVSFYVVKCQHVAFHTSTTNGC